MRISRRRIHTRTIAAATLICASFISAYVLSTLANQSQLVWGVRTSLSPGSVISPNDLIATKVAMLGADSIYIPARYDVLDFYVLKPVKAGELLPVSAISQNAQLLQTSSVPLSIRASDLPLDLHVGEEVNLYHVGDPRLATDVGPPTLLTPGAYILGIDAKGQNLGGDLTLTVSIKSKSVMQLLEATSNGRVVVVRING